MSHEPTSSSLLQRVKQHEAEAWDRLVHVYSPLIYDWCRQQGLQPVDAADVSQEVFRSIIQTIERFRHERPSDSFRGWLWTVTRNKIRDSLRAKTNGEQATGGTTMMRRMNDLPDAEPVPAAGPSDGEITNDPCRRVASRRV